MNITTHTEHRKHEHNGQAYFGIRKIQRTRQTTTETYGRRASRTFIQSDDDDAGRTQTLYLCTFVGTVSCG